MDTGFGGRLALLAGTGSEAVTVESASLEDYELRFCGVKNGSSEALPLPLPDDCGLLNGLEVIVPPLAPFSVVERRLANRARPDGRTGSVRTTRLWIRYDATSPMANDTGRIVVRNPGSGKTWAIRLSGSSDLAPATTGATAYNPS